MTDLETELREAMRAAVADARPPRDLFHLLRHRRRRNRTRQLAISAAMGAQPPPLRTGPVPITHRTTGPASAARLLTCHAAGVSM